jgi:hypothetical protein
VEQAQGGVLAQKDLLQDGALFTEFRVLGQVHYGLGSIGNHFPGIGEHLAGHNGGQGGFTGSIQADKTNFIPFVNGKGNAPEEGPVSISFTYVIQTQDMHVITSVQSMSNLPDDGWFVDQPMASW